MPSQEQASRDACRVLGRQHGSKEAGRNGIERGRRKIPGQFSVGLAAPSRPALGRLALRARVRLVVDGGQVLKIEVGIDLCRGDAGVTEHLLHGA